MHGALLTLFGYGDGDGIQLAVPRKLDFIIFMLWKFDIAQQATTSRTHRKHIRSCCECLFGGVFGEFLEAGGFHFVLTWNIT